MRLFLVFGLGHSEYIGLLSVEGLAAWVCSWCALGFGAQHILV